MCAHFGWTLDYVLWGGVSWVTLQKMLADGPRYNPPKADGTDKPKPKNVKKLAQMDADALREYASSLTD